MRLTVSAHLARGVPAASTSSLTRAARHAASSSIDRTDHSAASTSTEAKPAQPLKQPILSTRSNVISY